jgi:catechol 2,3-dioxygenase-like lactoylglutathione lyase family enzyme
MYKRGRGASMAAADARPGPKPKRLYVRVVIIGEADRDQDPTPRQLRTYLGELDRVGRLVAHGRLTDPPGDLLVFRATSEAAATRILRPDPYRTAPNTVSQTFEWDPTTLGAGVNLEPPPARGSGRITALQRVAVVVRDQARAVQWYRETLGMTVRSQDPGTGYVELTLGRGAAGLTLVEPKASWGEPYYSQSLARIGGPTGIAFQTDSVLALEQRLKNAGAGIIDSPARQPWGGVALSFSDPDGNEFVAFQERADPGLPIGPSHPRTGPPSPPVRWTRAPPRRKPH